MSLPKSILCLIPSLGSGGAERQMIQLIQLLNSEYKIHPTVVTYSNKNKDYPSDIIVTRVKVNEASPIKRFFAILKAVKNAQPEAILSYGDLSNIISVLMQLFYNKAKVVVSERNTSLKYDMFTRLRFNLFRFADAVVVNSNSQTEFIKQHARFLIPKLKTINNFTDISKFTFAPGQINSISKIGIFARYHSQKNTVRFLEAVKMLNDKGYNHVQYYWYGQNYLNADGGPTPLSAYYFECLELQKNLGLANVSLNGFEKNVGDRLNEMDAICLPSLYEGFSNTLSEAICCGKPILTGNVCDNPTFCIDGENGFLFDPFNAGDMASAIEKAVTLNNDEAQRFQAKSRELAENIFSKDKFLSAYVLAMSK
ncbi:glycosyltransferase [Mucilaginibacter terrigena]|uniref:Glycosyltransferase n=1 Tax=Mucilaginibacter terrigena TaxID=2492395 RepID=A0A4V1ZBS9_9SPHI|nr:glycosyltransferase [Mucilaginibacter terrigena]RYU90220.1 glycosyltransferase [Mucilaginibacter terrigena]